MTFKLFGWISFHRYDHVGIPLFQDTNDDLLIAQCDEAFSIQCFHNFKNEDNFCVIAEVPAKLVGIDFKVGSALPIPFRVNGKNYFLSSDANVGAFLQQFGRQRDNAAVQKLTRMLVSSRQDSLLIENLSFLPRPFSRSNRPSARRPHNTFSAAQDVASFRSGGMDGFIPLDTARRRTLKTAISCVGVGVHSGRRVSITLRPGLSGVGIHFRRTDLGVEIPARWDLVCDTRLCTALALPDHPEARVGSIEMVMAALAGCGIDDAIIEVDGPEVPILDGSAAPFVFLIDCAGTVVSHDAAEKMEVLRPIRVEEGDAWAELSPLDSGSGLDATLSIDFPNTAIGRQALSLRVTPQSFRHELADARTFTLAAEVEHLRAIGLAQGGSLANAIVVDGPVVLNPGGLRRPDEFVRHKLLDVVGDLALAGAPLKARFAGHRSGHALNNRLLRTLFVDAAAWRKTAKERNVGDAALRYGAAAAPAVA